MNQWVLKALDVASSDVIAISADVISVVIVIRSPGEIKDVEEVWKKWKGKEASMFLALATKYKDKAQVEGGDRRT